jgi:hypothetical protein
MWHVVVLAAYAAAIAMFVMSLATVLALLPVRTRKRVGRLVVGKVYGNQPRRDLRDAMLALVQSILTVYLTSLLTPGPLVPTVLQLVTYVLSLAVAYYLLRDTAGAVPLLTTSGSYVFGALAPPAAVILLASLMALGHAALGENDAFLTYQSGDKFAEDQRCNVDQMGGTGPCFARYSWDLGRLPGRLDTTMTVETDHVNFWKPETATVDVALPGRNCPVDWSAWNGRTRLGGAHADRTYGSQLTIPLAEKALRFRATWARSPSCRGQVSLSTSTST